MVIGLDAELQEAYSFGRRNPRIPFFAGFERENAFPKSGSDAPPEAARYKKNRYIDFSDKRGARAELQEAYSFGRRNPRIPFFAGFEREDKEKILRAFPTWHSSEHDLDILRQRSLLP